jgi:hypothetical protein
MGWQDIAEHFGIRYTVAQRLYAQYRRQNPEAKNRPPKAPTSAGSAKQRKYAVQNGTPIIPEDTPDQDIVRLIAGNTIRWSISLQELAYGKGEPGFSEAEAKVHPWHVEVSDGFMGERCVTFVEYLGIDSTTGRPIGGPTRTVRVSAIHSVR